MAGVAICHPRGRSGGCAISVGEHKGQISVGNECEGLFYATDVCESCGTHMIVE